MPTLASIIVVIVGVLALNALSAWVRHLQFRRFRELEQLSDKDRNSVWDTAWSQGGLQPISALIVLIAGAALLVFYVVLTRWIVNSAPGSLGDALIHVVPYGGAALGLLVCGYFFQRHIGRAVRCELNRRGYPICVTCGYLLRDLPAPRCPDCGATFITGRCTRCDGAGAVRSYMVTIFGAAVLLIAVILATVAVINSSSTIGVIAGGAALIGLALICMNLLDNSRKRCPHCLGAGVIKTRRKWEPLIPSVSAAPPPADSPAADSSIQN